MSQAEKVDYQETVELTIRGRKITVGPLSVTQVEKLLNPDADDKRSSLMKLIDTCFDAMVVGGADPATRAEVMGRFTLPIINDLYPKVLDISGLKMTPGEGEATRMLTSTSSEVA